MNKSWNEHEDKRLIELHKTGMTFPDIGSEMGRSRESVRQRATKLGLRRNSRCQPSRPGATGVWTEAEDDRLRALASEGLSARAISAKLGRSMCSVRGRANRIGISIGSAPGGAPASRTPTEPRAIVPPPAKQASALLGIRDFRAIETCFTQEGCQWITGEGDSAEKCGKALHAKSYCQKHFDEAYKGRAHVNRQHRGREGVNFAAG